MKNLIFKTAILLLLLVALFQLVSCSSPHYVCKTYVGARNHRK